MVTQNESLPKVLIVSEGMFDVVVCAEKDATDDEILTVCNHECPCGTKKGWFKVIRETDADEESTKLVVCKEYPDRLHMLVSC